jgi:D-methionine transport system substrate-binding protein
VWVTTVRVKFLIINLFLLLLLGCSPKQRADNEIYIGTIVGPESKLVEAAKEVAEKQYGLKLTLITFEDYVMPNTALVEGAIDANMFQHQPYLDVVLAKKHYPIEAIGKMFIYPMGIYSQKVKSLDNLPNGAIIGIPNDPSNGARALRLLAKAKLISIPEGDDFTLTPQKITHNPHGFVIKELSAAQLPRVLNDLTLAVINTNYAIPAGLIPNRDALFIEDKDSPYANIVVIRSEDKNKEKYKKLMDALHSPEVVHAADKLFPEHAIAAW